MKPIIVSADRFRAIVDAYGATPDRWPEAERDACLRFITRDPLRAEAWLSEARAIDDLLETGLETVSAEDAEVRDSSMLARLLAAMPAGLVPTGLISGDNVVAFPRRRVVVSDAMPAAGRRRTLPLLWTSIGLAACIAGAGVGMKVSLSSLDTVRAQTVLDQAQVADAEN